MSLIISLDLSQWKSLSRSIQTSSSFYSKQLHITFQDRIPNIIDHIDRPKKPYYDAVHLHVKDPSSFRPLFDHQCPNCWKRHLRIVDSQSIKVCTCCGYIVDESCCSDSVSYLHGHSGISTSTRQSQSRCLHRNISQSHVKRLNHFRFWVQKIQGKESTRIPQDVLNRLYESLQVNPQADISHERIRRHLKKLKLQRYYNNIYYIMTRLGKPPLVCFSRQHEKMLEDMFIRIQQPFYKATTTRSNMISYPYIIRKICEINGWQDLARQIPLLKNRRKVYELDQIWKSICDELSLPFIKSL